MQEIFNFFPLKISRIIKNKTNENTINLIEEIRIRNQKPIILKFNSREEILSECATLSDILEIMQKICNNSIYSFQHQICNGYITIKGGHRVGIVGNCVLEGNHVININYISGLNFRIAKQIIGCSNDIIKHVINKQEQNVYNTLIVSPPGAGKTTLLRDLIRNISTGIRGLNFKGLNVGVVDERGEISAVYKGVPQNDIGIRTDVLDNVPKAIGLKMLIRSMAPQVICADEIGKREEIEVIKESFCCGIKGIFTAHGSSFNDIVKNPILKELVESNILQRIIILDNMNQKGKIKSIYELAEDNYKKRSDI